jgi:uncharacterized membrane protein
MPAKYSKQSNYKFILTLVFVNLMFIIWACLVDYAVNNGTSNHLGLLITTTMAIIFLFVTLITFLMAKSKLTWEVILGAIGPINIVSGMFFYMAMPILLLFKFNSIFYIVATAIVAIWLYQFLNELQVSKKKWGEEFIKNTISEIRKLKTSEQYRSLLSKSLILDPDVFFPDWLKPARLILILGLLSPAIMSLNIPKAFLYGLMLLYVAIIFVLSSISAVVIAHTIQRIKVIRKIEAAVPHLSETVQNI